MFFRSFFLFILSCSLCLALTIYSVPSSFFRSDVPKWNELINSIKYSQDKDFILLWQGIGGDIDLAEDVFYKLNHINKNIKIKIIGPAISAHGVVACYLPNMIVFNKGSIVLHNAFDGRFLNGNKRFNDRITRDLLNNCVLNGIISREEEYKIITYKLRIEIYPNGNRILLNDYK